MTEPKIDVVRNDQADRYEIHVDGELSGFTAIEVEPDATVMPHTEIDGKFEGRGLSKVLIQRALDDLRSRGDKIVPTCPAVARFINKHPEYADLVTARS